MLSHLAGPTRAKLEPFARSLHDLFGAVKACDPARGPRENLGIAFAGDPTGGAFEFDAATSRAGGNRLVAVALALAAALLIGACGGGAVVGRWQGDQVHLVDGTWIGAEVACGSDDVECRTVVRLATEAVDPQLRNSLTRVALAQLPSTFVTTAGETRIARLTAGILTRKAVVIDLHDGTRRVIGLWCHLPYASSGVLRAAEASCHRVPLDDWLDGNAPPSIPPGTTFG